MFQPRIQSELLAMLAQNYEESPCDFVILPKQTVDSSDARVALAELRNEGFIEEQQRGIVRLTIRGYLVCKQQPRHKN